MKGEVGAELFTALYLALLSRIYTEYPKSFHEKARQLGIGLGNRLADDFFAQYGLFTPIPKESLETYLRLFLKHYFNTEPVLENGTLRVDAQFMAIGESCSTEFLSGLLTSVFKYLHGAINFEALEDCTVKYTFTASGALDKHANFE